MPDVTQPNSVQQTLRDLLGQPLDGFTIEVYTEVYRENEDGRKTLSIGYFKDEDVAVAFAGSKKDASYFKTHKEFLLTNKKVAFLLSGDPVELVDEEKARLAAREYAWSKLTAAERKLLKVSK